LTRHLEKLLAIVLLLLAVNAASGQGCWYDQYGQLHCEPQPSGGDYRIGEAPQNSGRLSRTPNGQNVAPVQQMPPWEDARIVRVRNGIGNGFDWGSGCIITMNGRDNLYVLTAGHVTTGEGDWVTIVFNDGHSYDIAQCLGCNRSQDWAILKLHSGARPQAFKLADSEPKLGDVLTVAGFPDANRIRIRQAKVVRISSENFDLQGGAISGESGGPVCTADGKVIGVIYATTTPPGQQANSSHFAICCRPFCFRRWLDQAFPNRPGIIIPREPNLEPVKPLPLPPQAEAPPHPPEPEPDIDYESWENWQREIKQENDEFRKEIRGEFSLLISRLEAMQYESVPGPVGPPGPAGPSKPFFIRVRNPKTGAVSPYATVNPGQYVTLDLTPQDQ